MKFDVVLMLITVLILALTGCAGNAGYTKVEYPFIPPGQSEPQPAAEVEVAEQECWGISWVFGEANNGCGLSTGGLSIPGLDFVLGLVDAAKGLGLGLIGQSEQPAPVFNFSGIEPVQPESD